MFSRVLAFVLGVMGGAFLSAQPATVSSAGVEFKEREITRVAAAGLETVEAEFVFTNRSDRTLQIREIKASCGCTSLSLAKMTYAPGEEGRLAVTFAVGSRQGAQRMGIKMLTDLGDYELVLAVDIPPRIKFSPRLLLFRGGDDQAKTARVTFHAAHPVTLLEAPLPGEQFKVTVREVEAGRIFDISATYLGDAAQAQTAAYELRSRDAAGREHTDKLFLRHLP